MENTNITIHRTLLVLRTIAFFRGQWFGVGAIAEKAGLAPSTMHRYLQAFVDEKLLDYEPTTGKYRNMVAVRKEQV